MQDSPFTKYRSMIFPRNVFVGHDVLGRVPDVCQEFDFERSGLLVSGDTTYKKAGKAVKEYMEDGDYHIDVHLTGEATFENLDVLLREAREFKSRFILGVGGGSKIDICKMAAKELDIPFVCIPTSAAHDGVASGRASMKGNCGPKSVDAVVPLAVVADTKVIVEAPYRLLASGCADVISNSTALMDWEFAHRLRNEEFSRSARALSEYSAETIIENSELIRPGLEESVWISIRPIIISGISMSVAGSSRPTSGAEHMFSHALDLLYPTRALHGEQCGVGTIMMMYLHGGDWRRIQEALRAIGAPITASELGYDADQIVEALVKAHQVRSDRFTILGDRGLSPEAAERVATITQVI